MDYIIVENNTKAQIRKLISNNRHNDFYFIFNIKKTDVSVQRQLFYTNLGFDVGYIIELFKRVYTKRPMVFEVKFEHSFFIEGNFKITYTLITPTYDNYEFVHMLDPQDKNNNYQLLQILPTNQNAINYRHDRNEFSESTIIFRESNKKAINQLTVIHKDKLGFAKAEKINTLCEKCHYYDEDNYYIKCAVLPHVDHESTYQCREYQCITVEDVVDKFLNIIR